MVKAVVQKVRIDLGLQHLIAGILQKQLLFVIFMDQGVDLAEHRVHIAGQRADLIGGRHGGQHGAGGVKIAALHSLDRLAQGMHRAGDKARHPQHDPAEQHKDSTAAEQQRPARGWFCRRCPHS